MGYAGLGRLQLVLLFIIAVMSEILSRAERPRQAYLHIPRQQHRHFSQDRQSQGYRYPATNVDDATESDHPLSLDRIGGSMRVS